MAEGENDMKRYAIGLDNFCKLLDDDFEEYEDPSELLCTTSEIADDISDNSDEELHDVGLNLTVHRPLKLFKVRQYQTMSGKLMAPGNYEEMILTNPKEPALLCSVPGIGYLRIFKFDEKNCRLVIEDPFHPEARHEFFSFVHARIWLNRILKHFMVFESSESPDWIIASQIWILRKYWHRFDPVRTLHDKTVTVTKDGLLSLKSESERTERAYYRKKMMKYTDKLANLVFSKEETKFVLPLPAFLQKVMQTVRAEEKRLLQYEYEVYTLLHKRSKLKPGLRAALINAKEGEDKQRGLKMLSDLNDCIKDPSRNKFFMREVPVIELSDDEKPEEIPNKCKGSEAEDYLNKGVDNLRENDLEGEENSDKGKENAGEDEDNANEDGENSNEDNNNSDDAKENSDEGEENSDEGKVNSNEGEEAESCESEDSSCAAEEASDKASRCKITLERLVFKSWDDPRRSGGRPPTKKFKRSERIRQQRSKSKSSWEEPSRSGGRPPTKQFKRSERIRQQRSKSKSSWEEPRRSGGRPPTTNFKRSERIRQQRFKSESEDSD